MQKTTMLLNELSDIFWWSSSAAGNYFHIVVYSLISAILFLLIFKKVSNQEKIRDHKKKIFGYILQMRLYQDRLRLVVSSIGGIFKHNLLYMRHALSSLLVVIIPLFLISIQINNRCGHERLTPDRPFIITARLDDASTPGAKAGSLRDLTCIPSPGLVLETLPLRIPEEKKVLWRARVEPGGNTGREYIEIGFKSGGGRVVKEIAVASDGRRFTPESIKWGGGSAIMSNAEGFLPDDSPVSMISVSYPRAAWSFLYWEMDALVLYFVLTLVFALAVKPFMRVSI